MNDRTILYMLCVGLIKIKSGLVESVAFVFIVLVYQRRPCMIMDFCLPSVLYYSSMPVMSPDATP